MWRVNPCLTCGACCAHYRVSFYWGEADPTQGGSVPPELTAELDSFRRCMRGTNQSHPRCIALVGEIGSAVYCTIYAARPSPCQAFGVIWQTNGELSGDVEVWQRCIAARAAFGLPPLTNPPVQRRHAPHTWEAYRLGKHHRGNRPHNKPHRDRRSPGGSTYPPINPGNFSGSGA